MPGTGNEYSNNAVDEQMTSSFGVVESGLSDNNIDPPDFIDTMLGNL